MVAHIVMWNFNDSVKEEEKERLKKEMKVNLEALVGKVPGLMELKFISDPIPSSTHDFALVSKLEQAEDIKVYATHPEHLKVADTYVRPYACDRACLDYEIK